MLYAIDVTWRDLDNEERETSTTVEAPAYRVVGGQVRLPVAMVRWAEETIGPDADGHAGRFVSAITFAHYFPAKFTRASTRYPESCAVRSTLAEYSYREGLHATLAARARAIAGLAADAAR